MVDKPEPLKAQISLLWPAFPNQKMGAAVWKQVALDILLLSKHGKQILSHTASGSLSNQWLGCGWRGILVGVSEYCSHHRTPEGSPETYMDYRPNPFLLNRDNWFVVTAPEATYLPQPSSGSFPCPQDSWRWLKRTWTQNNIRTSFIHSVIWCLVKSSLCWAQIQALSAYWRTRQANPHPQGAHSLVEQAGIQQRDTEELQNMEGEEKTYGRG